jgi:soluble lytic murein transglycosylase-like protein
MLLAARRCLLTFLLGCVFAGASICFAQQSNAPAPAAAKPAGNATAATAPKNPAPANPSVADAAQNKPPAADAGQMSPSLSAMLAAIEKQKAAIQSQVGKQPSDSFFSVSWTSPPSIPVPAVIPACSAIPEEDLSPLVSESAKAQDIKPELIRAVIRRESESYPCAISERGAIGLMQLMPEVAQQFGVDPLDPKQNVQGGSRYLKQLMTRYKGDLRLALAAYNAGPQRVDAVNKVPDIPETTAYVDAILKDLKTNASPH